MSTLTQPLKWHGGKHYLAKRIIKLMPTHLHYIEPFFGGGAVLLARDPNRDWFIDEQWSLENGEKVPAHLRGCSEVVNDINHRLTNFWNTLKGDAWFEEFRRIIEATPFSKWEYNKSQYFKNPELPGPIAAAEFFIHARQSMAGRMNCFTPLTRNRTRGGRNAEANAWWNCIDGLTEVHERLKGVVILNDDACKVIRQQDGEKTLFYLDPPYLQSTRSSTGEYGEHELSFDDHARLLSLLANEGIDGLPTADRKPDWLVGSLVTHHIKGKWILSGYRSQLYDATAELNSWHRIDIEIDNKASSAKKKKKKTECLWLNYEPEPKP